MNTSTKPTGGFETSVPTCRLKSVVAPSLHSIVPSPRRVSPKGKHPLAFPLVPKRTPERIAGAFPSGDSQLDTRPASLADTTPPLSGGEKLTCPVPVQIKSIGGRSAASALFGTATVINPEQSTRIAAE